MTYQVTENPVKNRERLSQCLLVITSLIIMLYLVSNVMAVKIITVKGVALFDAGTITFPFAYMLSDVLTEIWGFKTARKVIYITFLCNILFVIFTAIGGILPYPDYCADIAESYSVVFTYVPRIVFASLVGFLSGELSNAAVMEKIKKMTKGKHMWIRTILSSAVGYVFDTILFVFIAFYKTAPINDLISMIAIQYTAKLLIEALSGTPLAYFAVAAIKSFCGIETDKTKDSKTAKKDIKNGIVKKGE